MGLSTRRAEWAALVPWRGIQGKPAWIDPDNPRPVILIADVVGLQAALNARPLASQLAAVAFSGDYNDLDNLPHFGSAAFVDIDYFQLAPRANNYQIGSVPFVAGQQDYTVVFTTTMLDVPKIETQVFMADDNGEVFFATIADDSLSTTGFKFWLNGVPTTATGRLQYKAFVQDQP